jgi:hypothetical protein
MARYVDPRRVEKYWQWRNRGATRKFAASEAGIGYNTAIRLEAGRSGEQGDDKRRMHEARQVLPPKDRDQLSPEALACLEDFPRFQRRYLGHIATPWQAEAAEIVVEKLATPDKEFVLLNAPPSVGKSTTFTLDIPLWLICRNRAIRGATFSNSQASANRYVMRVKRVLERTVPVMGDPTEIEKGLALDAVATLADDYGLFRPSQRGDRWAREEFVVEQLHGLPIEEKESTWTAFGFDATYLGMRLDVLIADDVVDKKNVKSLEAINKQREDWDDVAERRIDPGGLLLLQGQRLESWDLYAYCRDKYLAPEDDDELDGYTELAPDERRPLYHHIVFKAHYQDRCQGQHKISSPPYPDGCLLDPRRLTWREVATTRRLNPKTYSVVMQQEDTSPLDCLVKPVWVRGGTDPEDGTMHPGCWDKGRDICQLPEGLHGELLSYATVDPSAAKWWSVQWWVTRVVDFVPQERFLMDHHRARMQASDLLDWQNPTQEFAGLMETWQDRSRRLHLPISRWIVERNGAQRYLLAYEHVWRWCSANRTEIIPHETQVNKIDPEFGVEQLLPGIYRWGLVRLPAKGNSTQDSPAAGGHGWTASIKLVEEVTTYPHSLTADCVMAQWFGEFWLPRMIGDGKRLPRLKVPGFLQATDTYAWARKALWGKEKVGV